MRRLDPCLAPAGYSPRRYETLSPAPVLGMGERMTDLRDIQALFANGEQGGYWPADPAYAYEDSAGTIPASLDGVVGLRFDVSKGLALGAITTRNYDFANGANQWIVSGDDATHTITFTTGSVRYQSGTTSPVLYLSQPEAMTPNAWNKLTITVSASNGGIMVFNNNGFITLIDVNPGSRSVIFKTGTTESYLNFYRGYPNQDVTFTSLIIQPILGNHAIQSTTANKPYLRRTPTTGKYWYDSNTATGEMNVTFASALGSSCTIATVTPEGVSILENKTVGTTYNICPPYGYNSDVLIINRALTPAEKALVTRVMQRSVPTLGSELVDNGAFDTNINGWTNIAPTRGTVSWDNGRAKIDGTGGNGSSPLMATTVLTNNGSCYLITADFSTPDGSIGYSALGGVTMYSPSLISNGTYKSVIKKSNSDLSMSLYGTGLKISYFDNASCREIL